MDEQTCTRSASCGVYLTVRDVFQFLSDTYFALGVIAFSRRNDPYAYSIGLDV